jgi:hypothetical protein
LTPIYQARRAARIAGLTQQRRHAALSFLQYANLALLLPLLLGCTAVSSSAEDAPASGPDPSSNTMVANLIKESFKDYASYEDFEISAYRWVHSPHGWVWLTCVRYEDKGRRRTYAVFIKGHEIADNRYAVRSDACDGQTYTPFTLLSGAKPANSVLEPLY